MRQQKFREDLFYRITIIPLRIPPVRERPEDIPVLADEILGRIAADRGCETIRLDPTAMSALQHYPWPGNIREMRNVLERAAQISQHSVLSVKDLELQYPAPVSQGGSEPSAMMRHHHLTLCEVETHYIEAVLQEESGSIERAARRLGISRSSLYGKVKAREVARGLPN